MLALQYYPIVEYGPLMKGLVIGGLGIFHVFLAQFAIGGGFLLCMFEWQAQKEGNRVLRRFLDGYFRALVLVSFVAGALTGVGMWLTAIQVSPQTIGLMVREFHWIWAVEWTFFCVEVAAGYLFYRYAPRLADRTRLGLLVTYTIAAWFSLFWINGILSWQLTPGSWVETRNLWAGFFNPSFWPSLVFRTVCALATAGLVGCVVINTMTDVDRPAREDLVHRAARLLLPMALMPVLGAWYLAVMPADSRTWVLGGSPAMTMFLALAVITSACIALYAFVGIWKQRLYLNGATATLLLALAFLATAGGEFVREGSRKPYTVREHLYSNAIHEDEVQELRERGSVTDDPYPLRDAERYPTDSLALGAKVYRLQCSVCHTIDGANGLKHLTETWSPDQLRMNLAKLQRTKPFMPPFAGSARELDALADLLTWIAREQPGDWEAREPTAEELERIERWLDEAGTTRYVSEANVKEVR